MKFATEKDSIDYLVIRMQEKGYTNINPTQSTDPYCYYDLEAKYKGKKLRIEVKRRNYKSDKFGDHIIEKYKYDKFIDGLQAKEFDNGILISLFEDCFVASDITKPYDIDFIFAGKTTDFENKDKVEKTMVHFHQDKKFNY